MVQWITKNFTAHRYRPLLYVEWVLGIVALSFFVAPSQWMQPDGQSLYSGWFWVLWGVLFIIFMAAGLAHPTKPAVKAAYLSGLLLMVFFLTEGGLYGVEAFLIIILLRSSLLYRTTTCVGWAGLLLIIYAGTLFLAYQQFTSFPEAELIDPTEVERVTQVLEQSDKVSSSTMVLIGSLSDVLPSYQFIKIYFIEKTVSFGLILLFVLLIAHSYKNERDSRQKLAAAYTKAQSKVATIATEAAETERDRIARDIHDTLGHALTDQYLTLQNTAEALRKNDYASVAKLVSQGNSTAKHALSLVRAGMHRLRHNPLGGKTFMEALEDSFASYAMDVSLTNGWTTAPSSEAQATLYYVISEALKNTQKHSNATAMSIVFAENNREQTITISDNGRGFSVDKTASGYGMRGMRERVEILGGTIAITSNSAGTTITITLPNPQ